jgi:UDP-glucose 4-epimerase
MADTAANESGARRRVVVTGATGNIGSAVVERLVADPSIEEVVGVARRLPTDAPGPGHAGAKASYVAADIGDEDETVLRQAFAGADVVVHLAWLFQPTHDPLTTWRANAIGSDRVFRVAAEAGVRAIVHASSVGAYSPGEGRTVDESWPTHSTPTAAYGREKAYVERVLDAVELRYPEVRVVRMRPGFVFQFAAGTSQRRIFAGPFVPKALLKRGRLPVVPLPAGLRFQAVHAHDLADAFHAAVVRDVRGAFNVASDPIIDADGLGEILGARVVTVPRAVVRTALAAGWHAHLVPAEPALFDLFLPLPTLDTTRARRELGWEPTRTGPEALREALDGMAAGAGGASEPLAEDSPAGRAHEVATGVGERP